MQMQAAIVIVSDTASSDPSSDKSGSILRDVFANEGGDQWTVRIPHIVRDDILDIQNAIMTLCDEEDYVNVLVTTGGTGFAVKDNTPEAVKPLLHKHAPGLV